jgi:hypothetical protein
MAKGVGIETNKDRTTVIKMRWANLFFCMAKSSCREVPTLRRDNIKIRLPYPEARLHPVRNNAPLEFLTGFTLIRKL